ncbi:MAG: hypothetical protein AVDCRST_MAG05-2595, partial [uncultured Rubrobacteraceae bacterium]
RGGGGVRKEGGQRGRAAPAAALVGGLVRESRVVLGGLHGGARPASRRAGARRGGLRL